VQVLDADAEMEPDGHMAQKLLPALDVEPAGQPVHAAAAFWLE
jgi:hypothetical protein